MVWKRILLQMVGVIKLLLLEQSARTFLSTVTRIESGAEANNVLEERNEWTRDWLPGINIKYVSAVRSIQRRHSHRNS